MRRTLLALSIPLIWAASPAAAACDAKAGIEAAFLKQQKSPGWRVVGVTQGQEQTVEYLQPDKVRRRVLVAGQEPAIETIAIGKWAWTNGGNGWGEMQPPVAKMIEEQVHEVLTKPLEAPANFSCLGKVSFDGKEYSAYRSPPDKGAGGAELIRTIYVDPATGLPAFNVIGPATDGAEPLLKETYSYPDDLSIEKP